MLDEIKIKAPAKLNMFIRILNKRDDGYHNIRSGITFINLFNELKVKISKEPKILYVGPFKPINGFYEDCIIKKTLDFLEIDKKVFLDIIIKKNIPVQAGLGSASTDAAALIFIIQKMKLIKKIDNYNFKFLGADIPSFLYGNDCIVEGFGEQIIPSKFPKYYFLLVKPNINFSTKAMYNQSSIIFSNLSEEKQKNDKWKLKENVNDFEKIIDKKYMEIRDILDFIDNSENSLFSRMTGSGSCCYGVFKSKIDAINSKKRFNLKFPNLWSFVCENNIINS